MPAIPGTSTPRQAVAPVGVAGEAPYVSTSISIQPDLLHAAKRRAREQGMGLSTYVRGLVLRDLRGEGQ